MFTDLKYRQVRMLIDILNEAKVKSFELIRKRHIDASENFDGTRDFLEKLGFIDEENKIFSMSGPLEQSGNRQLSDSAVKELLRNALLDVKSPLSTQVRPYLVNFESAGGVRTYSPPTTTRLRESGIRNFFIEIDLIEHDKELDVYKLNEQYLDLFTTYFKRKTLSPEKLEMILKEKGELGKSAELEIIRYEQERLAKYPELLAKIEHVALSDVSAGYDILSWETGDKGNRPVPRYIEVKAVSKFDSEFYWSRQEVEKAKSLAMQYSLYLLPVIEGERFDANNLEIISDPAAQILTDHKNWNCQVETYLFSKIHRNER